MTGYLQITPLLLSSIEAVMATLFVTACILLSYHFIKKGLAPFKVKSQKIKLGQILKDFSYNYQNQYQETVKLRQQYKTGKGNELDTQEIFRNITGQAALIRPEALLREFNSLLGDSSSIRIASVIADVINYLRYLNKEFQDYLPDFTRAYQDDSKEFYENFYSLIRLHDDLINYVKGKTLNKPAGQWLEIFFSIFSIWINKGANGNIETISDNIIHRVIELNGNHSNNPFVSQTNEKAMKCQFAFYNISRLDSILPEKLYKLSVAYKRAYKIMYLIGEKLSPETATIHKAIADNTTIISTRKKFITKKYLLISGAALLFCLITFWSGFHFGKRRIALPGTASSNKHLFQNAPIHKAIDTITSDTSIVQFPPIDTIKNIYGLDIAKYQGNFLSEISNLDTMHFVFCKATEGNSLVDAEFEKNWKRLRQMNILRGAYHFYVSHDKPVSQALHFLKTVDTLAETDIPLVLDIEDGSIRDTISKLNLQTDLLAFLHLVEEQTKRKPIIYTNLYFADEYLVNKAFSEYPLWLAEYSGKAYPSLPITWKQKGITFWQKSDSYTVDSKTADFDIFSGNGSGLIAFIKKP